MHTSAFLDLQNDVLERIQLHLRPRHLYRLLQTNRRVRELLLNNSFYWARVAQHLVFRKYVIPYTSPAYKLGEGNLKLRQKMWAKDGFRRETLFHMMNLERGYHWAMETFEALLAHKMATDILPDAPCWAYHAGADPETRVRLLLRLSMAGLPEKLESTTHIYGLYSDEQVELMPMRELVRCELEEFNSDADKPERSIKRVLRKLDDLPNVPPEAKRDLALSMIRAFGFKHDAMNLMIMISAQDIETRVTLRNEMTEYATNGACVGMLMEPMML
jgi:hypothetical protein